MQEKKSEIPNTEYWDFGILGLSSKESELALS